MIIKLEHYTEGNLIDAAANKLSQQIIKNEFKLYGDIPECGCYTPYDKFKNYIANLVADRIFNYMIGNDEIQKRIEKAVQNAEKSIVSHYFKDCGQRSFTEKEYSEYNNMLKRLSVETGVNILETFGGEQE